MLHRFQRFEIDEHARELRAGGRIVRVQPRVFDVIAYLARHRSRVVPKDELLETLWPDVVVTDASLQRAVSLARSACAELGEPEAIRTYARQGYRFCADEACPPAAKGGAAKRGPDSTTLAEARAAYAAAEWERAIALLERADAVEALGADDLQRWAHAAQCAGRMPEMALPLERALAAYAARGDRQRAGWVAVLLSQMHFEHRDAIAAKGWLHRAARLLEHAPESREHGYLNYLQARLGLAASELEPALAAAHRAHDLGRKHGDPDLEYLGLAFAGEIALSLGRIDEGMAALDEAGVAVRASGVSPLAGSIVYCGVISVCMMRADWERASRWTELFRQWCGEHASHAVTGLCRLHQAEVLNVRGDLGAAQRESEDAQALLARRSPWAEGEAWRVLGEIHLARGDLEAAEVAFRRALDCGWDPQPGLALLELERGRPEAALRSISRTLEERTWSGLQKRGLLLAQTAIIAALAGDAPRAQAAIAELDADPALWSTSALKAWVTAARGQFAAAEHRLADGITSLRAAIQQWHAIASPLPAAQTRERLAELLVRDGDRAGAHRELEAAAAAFERAGAAGALTRCRRRAAELAGSQHRS